MTHSDYTWLTTYWLSDLLNASHELYISESQCLTHGKVARIADIYDFTHPNAIHNIKQSILQYRGSDPSVKAMICIIYQYPYSYINESHITRIFTDPNILWIEIYDTNDNVYRYWYDIIFPHDNIKGFIMYNTKKLIVNYKLLPYTIKGG